MLIKLHGCAADLQLYFFDMLKEIFFYDKAYVKLPINNHTNGKF